MAPRAQEPALGRPNESFVWRTAWQQVKSRRQSRKLRQQNHSPDDEDDEDDESMQTPRAAASAPTSPSGDPLGSVSPGSEPARSGLASRQPQHMAAAEKQSEVGMDARSVKWPWRVCSELFPWLREGSGWEVIVEKTFITVARQQRQVLRPSASAPGRLQGSFFSGSLFGGDDTEEGADASVEQDDAADSESSGGLERTQSDTTGFRYPVPGSEVCKEQKDMWSCSVCTLDNVMDAKVCDACGSPKGSQSQDPTSTPDIEASAMERAGSSSNPQDPTSTPQIEASAVLCEASCSPLPKARKEAPSAVDDSAALAAARLAEVTTEEEAPRATISDDVEEVAVVEGARGGGSEDLSPTTTSDATPVTPSSTKAARKARNRAAKKAANAAAVVKAGEVPRNRAAPSPAQRELFKSSPLGEIASALAAAGDVAASRRASRGAADIVPPGTVAELLEAAPRRAWPSESPRVRRAKQAQSKSLSSGEAVACGTSLSGLRNSDGLSSIDAAPDRPQAAQRLERLVPPHVLEHDNIFLDRGVGSAQDALAVERCTSRPRDRHSARIFAGTTPGSYSFAAALTMALAAEQALARSSGTAAGAFAPRRGLPLQRSAGSASEGRSTDSPGALKLFLEGGSAPGGQRRNGVAAVGVPGKVKHAIPSTMGHTSSLGLHVPSSSRQRA
mmetsp:Transcript_85801/g.191017  ORF Transcript_85801/g.191017 Transcript_85801/m.191017 type:complete len:674 (+) Transcript_85801:101-2122(+)